MHVQRCVSHLGLASLVMVLWWAPGTATAKSMDASNEVDSAATLKAAESVSVSTLLEDEPVGPAKSLEEESDADAALQIVALRRTAADYMLDLRFTLDDSSGSAPILDRKIKPHLIHEKTGIKLNIPVSEKIGPLRQTPRHSRKDRVYFMFFANPARLVQSGDQVTIVIGDTRYEHIVVE